MLAFALKYGAMAFTFLMSFITRKQEDKAELEGRDEQIIADIKATEDAQAKADAVAYPPDDAVDQRLRSGDF